MLRFLAVAVWTDVSAQADVEYCIKMKLQMFISISNVQVLSTTADVVGHTSTNVVHQDEISDVEHILFHFISVLFQMSL